MIASGYVLASDALHKAKQYDGTENPDFLLSLRSHKLILVRRPQYYVTTQSWNGTVES